MTSDYKKLAIKRYAPLPGRKTAESRYWRKFKFPVIVKEYAAISCIDFAPQQPHDFAVTSATRVQIYNAKTNTIRKTLSRFKDVAHSGRFRQDGKLLVAGDDSGLVQVFELASREILRTFREHSSSVHTTCFSPTNLQILSGSDDTTLRCWDLTTGAQITCFRGHEDYVRTAVINRNNPDIWLSGSYDHLIKLWDLRNGSCTMTMDHGAPIEAVTMAPNGGGIVISAGGNSLKIWEVLGGGGRLLCNISAHQKTITSMCFDSGGTRLLSGSLDQHVKIYNTLDYKVTHSVKYPAPILSVALSPDDSHIVAGMSTGLLSIRERRIKLQEKSSIESARQRSEEHGGTYRYFLRGKSLPADEEAFQVVSKRKPRLRAYDTFLRKFQYKNALDAAMGLNVRPVVTISLLDELKHRNGLRIAISGRDDNTLEPILVFVLRNITNPRYAGLLIEVANIILDVYAPVVGQSMAIDDLFVKLRTKLGQETSFQKQLLEILGAMDMIFAASNHANSKIGSTTSQPA